MARLFVVPAVIVSLLLAVAVVVVLFGSTTLEKQSSIGDLLAILESDTGERTAGIMLLPKAKDVWQASQEIARRLQEKDKFLTPSEIQPTTERIIAILDRYGVGRDVEEPAPAQQYFLMMALAELESADAVGALVKRLDDPNWWTRRTALQALAQMHDVDEAQAALPSVIRSLNDRRPAIQVVACGAVACLAEVGDAAAVRALSGRLEAELEVQWNAAMALARLGSRSGKLMLLNMLDRSYWEGLELDYLENGMEVHRKYTELEVARNLSAAIEAAACLEDSDLAASVGALLDDPAHDVREAARVASKKDRSAGTLAGVDLEMARAADEFVDREKS